MSGGQIFAGGYPNQLNGWVQENDGSWSLYAPDGTLIVASRGGRAQVSEPLTDFDIANKKYGDDNWGGGGGGGISVTDGDTTVSPTTEIDFTSGATVTDAGGGVAQVAVGGSGLALTGWTEDDSDPANVTTNGDPDANTGGLIVGVDGTNSVEMQPGDIVIQTSGALTAEIADGIFSTPTADGGAAAFLARDTNGATVALDAGGLIVQNFGTLVPTSAPEITGALSTVIDAAAKDVLTSIISALTTLGLATDSTT